MIDEEAMSPVEAFVRTLAGVTAAAALLGFLVGGVGGRLAMFLLVRLSPEVDGKVSDDGFEMGRFTLSGTLNLLLAATFIGVIGGLVYFVVRGLMIGPRWFQVLSISLGAAVVVGSMLVHPDGIDFRGLHPHALAIALFLAIPGLFAAGLTLTAEPWIAPNGIFMTARKPLAFIPLVACIPLAPAVAVIVVVWVAARALRRAGHEVLERVWVQWGARGALAVVFAVSGWNLVSDVVELV